MKFSFKRQAAALVTKIAKKKKGRVEKKKTRKKERDSGVEIILGQIFFNH